MAVLSQELLDTSGFTKRVNEGEARVSSLRERETGLATAAKANLDDQTKILEEKQAATFPIKEKIYNKVEAAPSIAVDLVEAKNYQRPTIDPKEMQDSFGMLLAASMLTGISSRKPFYGVMQAMTGAMQGFMKQDDAIVKQSLAEWDRNLQALAQRNAKKREAVDRAFKEHQNDLQALEIQLRLIGAEYDDQQLLAASQHKSIEAQQKLVESSLKAEEAAIDRAMKSRLHAQEFQLKLEDQRIQRSQIAARADEVAEIRRQNLEQRKREHEDRMRENAKKWVYSSVRALHNDYLKETEPVRQDLKKIERILAYASARTGFADNQLRAAITEFIKSARGTNMMIRSLENFGSLDERLAGSVSRFFSGKYTPEQTQDIVKVFTMLRDDIIMPGLKAKQREYEYRAEVNKLPMEQVIGEGMSSLQNPEPYPEKPVNPDIIKRIKPIER